MANANHIYQPLSLAKREIRLIALTPDVEDREIQCRIRHVYLTDKPGYIALSYVWGDPSETREIKLDGYSFHVTVNLHTALRYLREREQEIILWIDAICINQSDVEERGHQVQLMREIYRGAEQVYAWIGEEGEHTARGMEIFHQISLEQEFSPSRFQRLTSPEDATWATVLDIAERPYWKRLWIVQEIALPQRLLRNLRESSVAFRLAYRTLNDIKVVPISQLVKIHDLYKKKGGIDFCNLIFLTNEYIVSDRRDRIYALLGLCSRNVRTHLLPNYDATYTLADLAVDLVQYLITEGNNLDIILGNRLETPDSDSSFPTWATQFDYSSEWRDNRLEVSSTGKDIPVDAKISPDQKKLHIKGYEVDKIAVMARRFEDRMTKPSENSTVAILSGLDSGLPAWMSRLREDYAWEAGARKEFSPVNDREALWRTLVWDCCNDNADGLKSTTPAPPLFGSMFESLLEWDRSTSENRPEAFGDSGVFNWCLPYVVQASSKICGRTFCITRSGLLVIGPHLAQEGDAICTLYGVSLPIVLRQREGEEYHLVGDAYVHGIMRDQAMANDRGPEREFVLS